MRSIEQPGPVHPERIQCALTRLQAVDVQLRQGVSLLDGLADAVREHGVSSAVFSLQGGSFAPLAYYMPALAETSAHVAYFSERFQSAGEAQMNSGSITFGLRDGQPSLHCHAIWTDASGQQKSGHLIPPDSLVATPMRLQAWMLEGVGFEVAADAETNFRLMQVAAADTPPEDANGLVVRLRPNQDICMAVEQVCAEHNITHANIRGGVGSLIGATFDDGRTVEAFVTEVFVRSGEIAPGPDGVSRARIDVGLVSHTGEIAEGRLERGENAVLITFELVIEPHDSTWRNGSHT